MKIIKTNTIFALWFATIIIFVITCKIKYLSFYKHPCKWDQNNYGVISVTQILCVNIFFICCSYVFFLFFFFGFLIKITKNITSICCSLDFNVVRARNIDSFLVFILLIQFYSQIYFLIKFNHREMKYVSKKITFKY